MKKRAKKNELRKSSSMMQESLATLQFENARQMSRLAGYNLNEDSSDKTRKDYCTLQQ